jgi:hypothetical protein
MATLQSNKTNRRGRGPICGHAAEVQGGRTTIAQTEEATPASTWQAHRRISRMARRSVRAYRRDSQPLRVVSVCFIPTPRGEVAAGPFSDLVRCGRGGEPAMECVDRESGGPRGEPRFESPSHRSSSVRRCPPSNKQSKQSRPQATRRQSTRCSTFAGRSRRRNEDSTGWFVECCDPRLNNCRHGARRNRLMRGH